MARRVLLGNFGDGSTFGLKISLPGYDVINDDDQDATKFSFNSEWTDFIKPDLIGTATPGNTTVFVTSPTNPAGVVFGRQIVFPTNWGYLPRVEVSGLHSTVVWDDHFVDTENATMSAIAEILPNQMILTPASTSGYRPTTFFYQVFKP